MDKVSYALGMSIGHQLQQMNATELNIDDFAQAVKDVFAGKAELTDADAQVAVQTFFQEKAEAQAKEMKAGGETFLAENGKKPTATDEVECHYEGKLIDGKIFDSSYQRGETATFGLNQVIAGWTEGLQLMQEGAKYRFYIPYTLGYGERGAGQSIPPYATLVFDVELIKVK